MIGCSHNISTGHSNIVRSHISTSQSASVTHATTSSSQSKKAAPEQIFIGQAKPVPKIQLTTRQIEELREAFNIFDTEGTGFISVYDFTIAMKALGFDSDKEEVKNLLWGEGATEYASRDRSGGITFQEFQSILAMKINQKDTDADLERAFELFDDDETGSISLKNLRRVARQLGEGDGDEELQAMLDAADRRGLGEVSLEDFKHVMRKAVYTD